MIDRRPALIVRCAGVADVIASVNFARDHDLVVAIRGGSHSVPGFSVCDAGLIVGLWTDPTEDEQSIGWVRRLWEAMQPFSAGGVYVNYETDAHVERVSAAYGQEKYGRLVALKNQYDPGNLFRLNQNIKPAS